MVEGEFTLQRYSKNGEKTGWTFIEIESDLAQKLKPDTKTSFRVKGQLDDLEIRQMALIPIGEGNFILPVKSEIRRKLRKESGSKVKASLEFDNSPFELSAELMICLDDAPEALEFFDTLKPGHQRYFSNWVDAAKTVETKTKRINQAIFGLINKMDYGQMIRHFKGLKEE